MKYRLLICLLIIYPFDLVYSQIGGDGTYRFLDLTNSAKVAALGGTQIAFTGNDLELSYYNPSLLSDSMRNQLSINYVSYIAGIGIGYVAYAPNLRGSDAIAFGIHYINYGSFEGATETGQPAGTFGAAEYALNLFYSRTITPRIKIGANLKPIYSSFDSYNSFGVAADLGITYTTNDQHTAIALVAKNLGGQITSYYRNGDHEKLPWDMEIGFSKQLAHAPIRFFMTANHLNRWNLSYLNRLNTDSPINEPSENITSMAMRHLVLGAELMPEQHVTLRLGYSYQRQKELSVDSRPGLVGFSAGLGVKIAKFTFNYGLASFHLAATAHYFSLSTNLSQFVR